MKLSRRELLAGGAATVATTVPARGQSQPGSARTRTASLPGAAAFRANLPIREYLAREARTITANALAGLKTPAEFKRRAPEMRRRFMDMMGLAALDAAGDRPPVPVHVTGVLERPAYRIEKLHYESLPNLHVTANLYVPKGASADAKRPGVLYVCGHMADQKVHYQGHAKRFAELGFPTLITETVQLGENAGHHHGCYYRGWFHWYSRGYSPAAIELLNGIRALDLLAARPEVDGSRLGVTGISGGGATTWWIAAADERVTACSPVCATATLESHIYDRVVDGHCDCMWWVNTALWDLADVAAMIAPRPLLIASANQDGIFPIDSIRKVHAQLEPLYAMLGARDYLRFVETPGGHSYHERSRTAIFSWFLEHLMGKRVLPAAAGDIELDPARLESVEALKVYVSGAPPADRGPIIHDQFITPAAAPQIVTATDVARARRQVLERLRADTFNHFPRNPPDLAVREEFALDGGVGSRFAFTSEDGWRLHATRRNPRDVHGAAPAVVVLRSAGEDRNASEDYAGTIQEPWVKVVVETRGTGDTSWGEDLNWHVRRASAWTGRTVASMRVWDALRALEAVRTLPGVDGSRLALAARGGMAAVALYAALLDGRIAAVYLDSPPATQNAPSEPNGRGDAIEMLNCLRYTDLPQLAGLLFPAEVVISGGIPDSYQWASELYRRLGMPAGFRRSKSGSSS